MSNNFVTEGNNAMAVDMGLVAVLEKYKDKVSIYNPSKTYKDGAVKYSMAFHFDKIDGTRGRTTCDGRTEEELWKKREVYLTKLYYQQQVKKESAKQVAVMAPVLQQSQQPKIVQKTVSEVIDNFMIRQKCLVTGASFEANVSESKHIKRHLGDKVFSTLTFEDVQNMIIKVAEGKDGEVAAQKTVENVRSFFTQVAKDARKQKLISYEDLDLITTGIKIPKDTKKYNPNDKFREYEELGKALHLLEKNKRYYLVIRILLLTGIREQELFALRFSDLHRTERYITVREALKKQAKGAERKFVIGVTKNEQSVRQVPAIPKVFEYFDDLELFMRKSGNRSAAVKKGNADVVIVDRNGNTINEHTYIENYAKYFNRRVKEVNAPIKMYQIGNSRHCYKTHLEKLHAIYRNIEISMGHDLTGVGDINYRADNEAYMEELYTYIEEMEEEIEKAYKKQRR